jgi:putative ABC transport system permease protein
VSIVAYYLDLALRSLRRNAILTALTVVAVAVGIGASMTVFTLFRALSNDPIPEKSSQLFTLLIDNWGPNSAVSLNMRLAINYQDATALLQARRDLRQSESYAINVTITPPDREASPVSASGHAASADFFQMFDAPFLSGRPWTRAEDESRAPVVVLSSKLADRLFPGQNPVGREVIFDQQSWRVIGVLRPWDPRPHFYDLIFAADDVFVPFESAVAHDYSPRMSACNTPPSGPGAAGKVASDCLWINFWVELPTAAAARSYNQFLQNYVAEQRRLGRIRGPALGYYLYDVPGWLARQKVVPDEVRLSTFVAFGFLAVCLLNAISLLLAKFTARVGSLSVHRALGASQFDVFSQCLLETALVGAAGGLLGLATMLFGLRIERLMLGEMVAPLTRLDGGMVAITLCVAVASTVACGVYPSWRASRVPPALQLKAQ